MKPKEVIERDIKLWYLGLLIVGFCAGAGSCLFLKELLNLDMIMEGAYIKKDELHQNYTSKDNLNIIIQ